MTDTFPRPLPTWAYHVPVIGSILVHPLVDRIISSYIATGALLILGEAVLNGIIISKRPYTEIDWRAYMSEVQPVLEEGDFNYANLRGGTGPIVYPGGFVWLYAMLFKLTNNGNDILTAQCIFAVFYLLTLFLVIRIYSKAAGSHLRPYMLVGLCLSVRVHSIFVLRLFNDGPAMLLLYLSLALLLENKVTLGCIAYSLAVSIKMNIFLFAPGLFLFLLSTGGILSASWYIGICALVQLLVGLPFLLKFPIAYISQSFNLSRTFKRYWSVNFKWVPCAPLEEESLLSDCQGIFTSKAFGIGLLALTAFSWILFSIYCGAPGAKKSFLKRAMGREKLSTQETVTVMLLSNFIGVVFSRSLHFQFYVWYFHSLPFLLTCTPLPGWAQVAVFIGIEACWNPWKGETSSIESSILLTVLHLVLLASLFVGLRVHKGVKDA